MRDNTVHCYEPDNGNLEFLRDNLAPSVRAPVSTERAVGTARGHVTLYRSADGKYSSTLAIERRGRRAARRGRDAFADVLAEVRRQRLPSIVKLDVEGIERDLIATIDFADHPHVERLFCESTDCGAADPPPPRPLAAQWLCRRPALPAGHAVLSDAVAEIKVLSHACLLAKFGGTSIIIDPWLLGSCYWRSWWNFPEARFDADEVRAVDAVVISHIHWDHWHGPDHQATAAATNPSSSPTNRIRAARTTCGASASATSRACRMAARSPSERG